MVHITSLEKGLKRLLGLCPKITLDPRTIQLIIDNKQNQVILEYKNAQKTKKQNGTNIKIESEDGSIITVPRETIITSDKAFDEYFKD